MKLSEALELFYKKATLNIPQEAFDRLKELVAQTASNGADNSPAYNKAFSENFSSIDDFLGFLNEIVPDVKKFAPQLLNQIDFIKQIVISTPKPKALPTQSQITSWQISQINKLKSKISDPKFLGFNDKETNLLLSYINSLVNALNLNISSSDHDKISELLDIVEGFSDDMFPSQFSSQIQLMKNNIRTALHAPKTINEIQNIRPEENSMNKLVLQPETDYLPPEYKSELPQSKFINNKSTHIITEPALPTTARINILKKLVK